MDQPNPLQTMFYAVSPNRTSFETVEEVPDYVIKVVPYVFTLWMLEFIFLRLKKKKTVRLNDAMTSASQGVLYEIFRLASQTWQISAYVYIHSNWKIVELPWNSTSTWWISVFIVDFLYYWQHRACHEVNFLWAAHQVHHSSEDYNLSTAMRQSAILNNLLAVFSFPVALVIPPSAFLVHLELNTLYQIWIHTEAIKTIGPLEYILNTASHHRVHHGRNRYCIDKNYAGVLIIWDRMFGTFEAESKEVVYGLTTPIQTFDSLTIQFSSYVQLWKRFWSTEGFQNKMSVLFKGPGWYPGVPRLGSIADIPDVAAPVPKYDPGVPFWCQLYVFFHSIILLNLVTEIAEGRQTIPPAICYGAAIYVVFCVIIFGLLLEGRSYAPWLEILRCFAYVAVDYYFIPVTRITLLNENYQHLLKNTVRLIFLASEIFWLKYCFKNVSIQMYCNSKKWFNTFQMKVKNKRNNFYFFFSILILILHNYYFYEQIPFIPRVFQQI